MQSTINTWLIRVFSVLWAVYLFLDYCNNSGYLVQAFSYFEYTGLFITAILSGFGFASIFAKREKPTYFIAINNFRNIYSYLFLLFFMGLIMAFYLFKTDITPSKASGVILFLIRTIGFHLALLPIILSAFGIGSFILQKLEVLKSGKPDFFISLAMGFVIMVLGLFLLGTIGLLNLPVTSIYILMLLVPGRKNILNLFRDIVWSKIPTFKLHIAAIIPYGIIIFMMAINFCFLSRPFPIGFDDLNLYMNIPKLISGYESLTQGGDAYNWSLVMSLGFILYKSATVSMLLSVIPGVLSLLVMYKIARKLEVSMEWSLFAGAFFYTLPNIIWQSRNDAKVDLALLFITLCGVLLLLEFYFSKTKSESSVKVFGKPILINQMVWIVCGLLIGFAFGIKYTSLLSIFAFLVFIFYVHAGKLAATGMFFLNFAIIFGLQLTRFAAFDANSPLLTIAPFIVAVIFFVFAIKINRNEIFTASKYAMVFVVAIGVTFIPWAIKNYSENKSLSVDALLTGKSPLPVLYPEMKAQTGALYRLEQNEFLPSGNNSNAAKESSFFHYYSTVKNSVKQYADASESNHKLERPSEKRDKGYTDKYEEIRRYLGYEKGVIRFISLPYDMAMKSNVKLWSADCGILLLIILPLLMLVFRKDQLVGNISKMLLMGLVLIASTLSVAMFSGPFELDKILDQLNSSAFADAQSFKSVVLPLYMMMKKLLLMIGNLILPVYNFLTWQTVGFSFMIVMFLSFLFYYLYKNSFQSINTEAKSIVAFTFCVLSCWMILSSGIFWYGMVGFSLITVVIALLIEGKIKSSIDDSNFVRRFIATCFMIWLVLIMPFQFMPLRFTLVKDMTQVDFKSFIDKPFAKYAIGMSSEKEVYKQFFQPAEQSILSVINNDKKAGVLNVSTFLTYHIVNNDQRVYADNQLGIFDNVYQKFNADRREVLNELKRKGIKYIVVSLYTPTLDMTPEKSLTAKYTNMMNLLVNNPGAQLLFTNRIVQRPDGNFNYTVDGKQVRAMYHLAGMRMLNQGSVACFQIL